MAQEYRFNLPHYFALTLFLEHGYPVALLVDDEPLEVDGTELGVPQVVHTYCERHDGVFVDFSGVFPRADLENRFGKARQPRTECVSTLDDIAEAFDGYNLPELSSQRELDLLRAYVRAHADIYGPDAKPHDQAVG